MVAFEPGDDSEGIQLFVGFGSQCFTEQII